jgi:hypothetical protein
MQEARTAKSKHNWSSPRGLGYGTEESLQNAESLSEEVGRMLVAMMNKLKR